MTDINWSRLRTWEGSQHTAFEKLCTQLAMYERSPEDGSRFIAKGNPDAGVECYWKLPDGTEWGWQAKFFSDGPPSNSQWQQLDRSFKRALEKHTPLTKYYACIPQDRADPKNEDSHFMDKWEEHVKDWSSLAMAAGREVEFVYWGSSEILERLVQDEHRGRLFFWFNEEYLDSKWFANRLEEEEVAEPRYTPEVDVDLPIIQQFEALGRTEAFQRDLLEELGQVRRDWQSVANHEKNLASLGVVSEQLTRAGNAIVEFIGGFGVHPVGELPFDELRTEVGLLFGSCKTCESEITQARETIKAGSKEGASRSREYLQSELYSLQKLASSVYSLSRILETRAFACANEQFALLRGPAGAGKTHLLFDVARNRLERNLPTAVLLGKYLHKGDPWTQIADHLQLKANRETLLGALEAAAQAAGRRAMILIDAINEGGGRRLWKDSLKAFLTSASRFPWVVVVVSIRTTYEKYVLPSNLGEDSLLRIDHHGFEGVEYEATEAFFRHFKIQTPIVPLLHPEFSNPLFLKLLCQGMQKASLTKIPNGFRGISQLFRFFVESANKRLAEILDYPEEKNLVDRALRALAAKMASGDQRWLSFEDAEAICQEVLHQSQDSKSLYRNLIHEGLLREECSWFREDNIEEGVMFAYERLADHLMAAELLDEHVDPQDPRAAFAPDQPLGFLAKSEEACWQHRGLIEAMSIQLPERFGLEFAELFPDRAGDDAVVRAFLESIAWRSSDGFSETTREIVNAHVIKRKQTHDEFLRILLRAAPDPEHPYNADFLHDYLMKYDMPHRDAWWSMFLHEEGPTYSTAGRLIDWAWSSKDDLDNDSRVLYGMILAWFLTTSNRYVRDRATKALVNLLTDHLTQLEVVLERFIDVDDPYVLERLLAAAYGAVLRTRSQEAIGELALSIYQLMFAHGNPPVHILTRDYARGVVEYAIHVDERLAAKVSLERVRPPYFSIWNMNVPDEDELRAHPALRDVEGGMQRAGKRIAFSIMSSNFGTYVIDAGVGSWMSHRLNTPSPPSPRDLVDTFEASLTAREAEAWSAYRAARVALTKAAVFDWEERDDLSGYSETTALKQQVTKTRERFLKTIRGKKKSLFENVIDSHLDNPARATPSFDADIARRWILNRVIELGWSSKLHGKIDAQLVDEAGWRSQSSPAERIGKKYQWIAYHEFLARVADNFAFRSRPHASAQESYDGPWQLGTPRDLDPSVILRESRSGNWDPDSHSWWFDVDHGSWDYGANWLCDDSDIPDIRALLEREEPGSNVAWLVLDGSYTWEQPSPPGEERYEKPRCQLWLHVHGYIIDAEAQTPMGQWAAQQNFLGDWMPRGSTPYGVFLGEFLWSPAYRHHWWQDGIDPGWSDAQLSGDLLPCRVLPICDDYSNDGSQDRSMEQGVYLRLPTKGFAEVLDLTWMGRGADFADSGGELQCRDPSAFQAGPSVLMARRSTLVRQMQERKLSVFWTVIGEKRVIGGNTAFGGTYPGRLEITGFGMSDGKSIDVDIKTHFVLPQ